MSTVADDSSKTDSRLERRIAEPRPDPAMVLETSPVRTLAWCTLAGVVAAAATAVASHNAIDWALIEKVPGAVVAALVIGPLTLLGVTLQNRSHDRRAAAQIRADVEKLELQLLHDADKLAVQLEDAATQAVIERESDMRRSVYLEAAEQLVRANLHLSSLPMLDFSKVSPHEGILGFAAANAKVCVVATGETLVQSNRLAQMYAGLVVTMSPLALGATGLRAGIASWEAQKIKLQATIDLLQAAMDTHVQSGDSDHANFHRLLAASTSKQKLLNDCASHQADLQHKLFVLIREYGMALRPHLDAIGSEQIKALALLRGELGLEVDESLLQDIFQRMRSEMSGKADEVFEKLERNFASSDETQ